MLEVVTAERSGALRLGHWVRDGDDHLGDLPFRADERLGVPRDVYRVDDELDVRGRVESLRWEGSRLLVEGFAHLQLIDIAGPDSDQLSLALVRGTDGRRIELPAERVARHDVTVRSRDAYCYDWAGFRTSVDTDDLRDGGAWSAGSWRLEVTLEAQGVRRQRFLGAHGTGRGTQPGASRRRRGPDRAGDRPGHLRGRGRPPAGRPHVGDGGRRRAPAGRAPAPTHPPTHRDPAAAAAVRDRRARGPGAAGGSGRSAVRGPGARRRGAAARGPRARRGGRLGAPAGDARRRPAGPGAREQRPRRRTTDSRRPAGRAGRHRERPGAAADAPPTAGRRPGPVGRRLCRARRSLAGRAGGVVRPRCPPDLPRPAARPRAVRGSVRAAVEPHVHADPGRRRTAPLRQVAAGRQAQRRPPGRRAPDRGP